jgi:hypothetical protein
MAESRARQMGSKELGLSVQTVPDSLTAVVEVDCWLSQLSIANKTGSAATFLVQDIQATAKTLVPTVSIPANTLVIIAWPKALFCDNGFKWQAGTASALDVEAFGWKRG